MWNYILYFTCWSFLFMVRLNFIPDYAIGSYHFSSRKSCKHLLIKQELFTIPQHDQNTREVSGHPFYFTKWFLSSDENNNRNVIILSIYKKLETSCMSIAPLKCTKLMTIFNLSQVCVRPTKGNQSWSTKI